MQNDPVSDLKLASRPFEHRVIPEISSGLLADPPFIASKYFYDLRGSLLFESITRLDAYYLTRTERSIMNEIHHNLIQFVGLGVTLVDLGAGNCAKAESLFSSLRPNRYIAVDIASEFLNGVLSRLKKSYPEIEFNQISHDFSEGLCSFSDQGPTTRLFFYPGSSIGNFTTDGARTFLTSLHNASTPGDWLLIGIDLVKDKKILEAAYNDSAGITRLFNLNILEHINRLASADFDVSYWDHLACYDGEAKRIEMHLTSMRDQRVRWVGGERFFKRDDSILTEYSHKYELAEFEQTLQVSGFNVTQHWTDDKHWFALILAQAR